MNEIELCDVPAWLYTKYGLEVTRQTVYNWINKGVNHEKLICGSKQLNGKKHNRYSAIRCVTPDQLDGFLLRAGIQLPHAGG